MKNRSYIFIVYLVLVSLVIAGVSLSRFATTMTGSGGASVGRPVIDLAPVSAALNGAPVPASGAGIDIGAMQAGDELVYKFQINNFRNGITNEVLLKYKISVLFEPASLTMPLTYTLTPDAAYPSAGGGWTLLGFDPAETHGYTLTVGWDAAETDPAYSNQQQLLQIIVNTEQTVSSGG